MKTFIKSIGLIICGCTVTVTLLAHEGATGIVKQRMDSMSEMGDAVKVIADMAKGKSEFNIEAVRASTKVLSSHAGNIVDHFPDSEESRNSHVSEALPAIWESWEKFEQQAEDLKDAVIELENKAALELDARTLRIVFARTAKACSACHDDFRKPQE